MNLGWTQELAPHELHFYTKILKYICRCPRFSRRMIIMCYITNRPISCCPWVTSQAPSQKLNEKKNCFPNQVPAGLFLLHVPCQISLCANATSARHSFPLQPLPLGQKGWHFSGDAVRERWSSAANVHHPFLVGWVSGLWALSCSFSEFLLSAETPGWCLDQLCYSFSLTQNDFFLMPVQ